MEMLGYVEFPAIERQPYRLTLAPYSFLWLELQRRAEPAEASADLAEQAPLDVTAGWESLLEGASRERLETVDLPEYLPKQRWFAGKSRHIKTTQIVDWAELDASHSALALVEVQFDNGPSGHLSVAAGHDASERLEMNCDGRPPMQSSPPSCRREPAACCTMEFLTTKRARSCSR